MESVKKVDIEKLLESGSNVVVDFYADWCAPCKRLLPIMEKLESEFPDVKFVKLNVSENQEYAAEMFVSSIPTIMFYNGSTLFRRVNGLNTEDFYRTLIKDLKNNKV